MWGSRLYDYGGYGYGGYGGFDEGVNYSGFKEKSSAAEAREIRAKAKFLSALDDADFGETQLKDGGVGPAVLRISLPAFLFPDEHLTGPCWKTFKALVTAQKGCSTKRRKATKEAMDEAGVPENRRRKARAAFIVDVVITAAAQEDRRAKAKADAEKSAAKAKAEAAAKAEGASVSR